MDGTGGTVGTAGTAGTDGTVGTAGTDGTDGTDGMDGRTELDVRIRELGVQIHDCRSNSGIWLSRSVDSQIWIWVSTCRIWDAKSWLWVENQGSGSKSMFQLSDGDTTSERRL